MYTPFSKREMAENNIFETPEMTVRPAEYTEVFKLSSTPTQEISVSHHETGLGKLKIYDKDERAEYGVPLTDILNLPLNEWRIDKK